MNFKEWFGKNKVILIGMASAVALAVSELVKGGDASVKVIVFSGMIAAASFLARNLRGQWATIIGLFGNSLAAYLTMLQTGSVSYSQLIIQLIVSILGVVASPAKSIGYEKTEVIKEATTEGEQIRPTP